MRFVIAFVTVMLSIGGGCTSTSAQRTSDCYARDDSSCICTANADGGSPAATCDLRSVSAPSVCCGSDWPDGRGRASAFCECYALACSMVAGSTSCLCGRSAVIADAGGAALENCPIVTGERACLSAPSNADPTCYTTSAPTCAAGDTPMNACDPEALSAQCRPSESAFTTCSNQ